MTRPYLLLTVVLVMLVAVVGRPLLAQRARRRALATGAAPTVEDPLVTWVASLRRDVTVPGRDTAREGDGPSSTVVPDDATPAESDEAPVGQGESLSATRGRVATVRPPEASVSKEQRRPGGQRRPAGPPSRRDVRRPGGPPPPAVGGRRARTPVAGSVRSTTTGPGDTSVRRWSATVAAAPRRTLLVTGLVAAALGAVAGGPVAAFAAGAYGAVGARALLRRTASRRAQAARRRRLDQLCDLAADLRAGLPVAQAVALSTDGSSGSGSSLARAAVHLADRTGAPLAELLERIDVDARSADRGLAAATAQAAGARATAWLLAVLPLGGIGLGYGIGVDPVAVLLHTPVGGGCAVLAVVLQVAGLLWAERLTSVPGRGD